MTVRPSTAFIELISLERSKVSTEYLPTIDQPHSPCTIKMGEYWHDLTLPLNNAILPIFTQEYPRPGNEASHAADPHPTSVAQWRAVVLVKPRCNDRICFGGDRTPDFTLGPDYSIIARWLLLFGALPRKQCLQCFLEL